MDISFWAISQFFKDRAADLRRIARATRGDFELAEVESEAWLVAGDVERKRGYPVDFSDRQDQEKLLGTLYNRLVKFAEKHVRYAVKLDADWEKEESTAFGAVLARLLTAPVSSDPQFVLEQRQDGLEAAVQRSYSEAAAYVLLLMRFEWDAKDLASHLRIALDTLRLRLKRAGIKVKVQPSLFDCFEKINRDFMPAIESAKSNLDAAHLSGEQCAWVF